ncbi:hypothetical protein SteCoe_11984 [Stentor coeruleus]|uniref:Uncharacterized protein n=1 Tax=Stentor coeruleus TaxID=5963 RepID=A0A1R2CBZ9_9CILI|nr:hypothetical protein SteCoe_11984 [Stentor coeruleus]
MEIPQKSETNQGKDQEYIDIMPSIIQDNSVGPGVYDLPSKIPGGPSYSFPQAERFQTPTGDNKLYYSSLTPEKYKELLNANGNIRSKSVPLNDLAKPSHSRLSDSPGPGQYEFQSTLYNKNITLKGKYKDQNGLKTPGPGAYEIQQENNLKFPQMKSEKLKQPVPITSNVQLINPTCQISSPSYSIGTRHRDPSPFNGPGPGAYNISANSSPGRFTIQGKTKDHKEFSTPGPGAYFLRTSNSSPAFSLGFPLRSHSVSGNPGPGQYDTQDKNNGPSYTMGKKYDKKNETFDIRDFSNFPSSFDQRGALIVGKPKGNYDNGVPGPGYYKIKEPKGSQGFSQGKSSREAKMLDTPGPGEYIIDMPANGPNCFMGKRYSPKKVDNVPGPGQYDLPEFKTQSPMLRGKPRDFKAPTVPGPGAYNPNRSQSCFSFTQGRSQRTNFAKGAGEIPGPGTYDVSLKNGKNAVKFSTSKRVPKFKPDSSAGFYKIDMKPDGPFYTMQGKRSSKNRNNTPGPGAYQVNIKPKETAPAYTMAPRREMISRLSRTPAKKFVPVRSNR